MLRIVLVLGLLTAVPSVAFAVAAGRHDIVVLDLVALVLVGAATFATTIAYRIRAVVLLVTAFALGVFFISNVGLVGLMYLLAVPVLAAVLLGLRAAVVSLGMNAMTLTIIGALGTADPRVTALGFEGPTEWLVISVNFLFMDAAMALSCALLLRRIERSLATEQALTASLRTERAALDEQNEALQREIAQRHRAEQQQRFHSQLLDAVGEAVIATDTDGIIRYLNPAAERLYGWPATDALGRPSADITVAAIPRPETDEHTSPVNHGQTWTGELEITRRDGTTFPALVTNAPYYDHGRLAGTIGVSADITQLREAIDRLARSEQIRTAFLRATSHELRTPLTAIGGFAQTLHRYGPDLDPARRTELTQRLIANTDRLANLVTDLLDVDRLSSGIVSPNLAPHDLGQLITRVLAETPTHGRRVELDLQPITANVDAPKIERVVAILIANAVRHTPPDGTISLHLRRDPQGPTLQISDTGTGIDPAYLDLVFEPFVQGPERHHDAKPGTGLGLTLARELITLHNGRITASNRPDGGACFQINLPD